MKIATVRLGEVEVPTERIFIFPAGILGFPGLTRYALLDAAPDSPFKWLQCADAEIPAFIVIDPRLFKPDYVVRVPREQLVEIELEELSEAAVWVILTKRGAADALTANLKGPLVANTARRLAKQLVLPDPDCPTRYVVFPGAVSGQTGGGD